MAVFAFVLLLTLVTASALIAPMKTSEGKIDMDSILTHVLLLEQTVSGLTKSQCRKSELDFVKEELQSVKSSQVKKHSCKTNGSRHDFVSFQVKAKTHPSIVNNNEVFKFDTVTLNTGGAYHAATGIFEAPVTGMYLFYANIMSNDAGDLTINLIKEGVRLVTGFSSRELRYGSAPINYIVEVNKGEKVWFTKVVGTLNVHGHFYSSYGGVLLYAL